MNMQRYEDTESGLWAAARHCDMLQRFADALEDCSGEEAVAHACRFMMESQTEVARLAGIQRSRMSEIKRKKKPTRQDKSALIGAFCKRWILRNGYA